MDPIHSAQSAVLALKEKTHAGIQKKNEAPTQMMISKHHYEMGNLIAC